MNQRSNESYGIKGLTPVDRFGVWLSQRAIRRHLRGKENLDVIEFGCGYHATQLIALRDRLRKGVGVDYQISPNLRDVPNLEFHEGPIENALISLPSNAFDIVMFISVLEHLIDVPFVLKKVFSILKPGGALLLNVPTWRGKSFLEFSAFRLGLSPRIEMDDHKMYYDIRDLWPLLVEAGFKPSGIKLTYYKFGLNLFATAHKSPE